MRAGTARTTRGLLYAALLAGALTACSDGTGEDAKPSDPGVNASTGAKAPASAPADDAGAVESGGTIGRAGSACVLPVSFDIAADWEPEAVEAAAAGDSEAVADLLRQGPVNAACEVDAKPAGHIGFLRVWTGRPGADDPREILRAFVADEDGNTGEKYGTFEAADGVTGAEVEYTHTNELLEETKRERAFAVVTDSGPVVVHLGGMDTAEHRNMLPAYELAKRTLRTN
ncbi:lipoprotein [Streptomyces sp. NPDC005017]|uniref:lipoprotein n=1 Tax=Streptomyces sp. NPDC005017 TaxID=3364706 RepID=UPI003673D4D3